MVKTQGMKEVSESLVLIPQTSDPTGEEGKLIYDNAVKTIKYWNGTQWIFVSGTIPGCTCYCIYNVDYAPALCEDFSTTSPYTVSNDGTNASGILSSIFCYTPTLVAWCIAVSSASQTCCKVLNSDIYQSCIYQYGCKQTNGTGVMLINNECLCFYNYDRAANSTSRYCLYNTRSLKLTNQCATSDILIKSCVELCLCHDVFSTCPMCNTICYWYRVELITTLGCVCNIDLLNACRLQTAAYFCLCTCCFNVCVCPANNCVYTNGTIGNVAVNFGTLGFLCRVTVSKFLCYCNTTIASAGDTYDWMKDTLVCITGNNLPSYTVDFFYKTSCQNITLPADAKEIAPALIGFLHPIGAVPYFNYCIVGVGNYTCQKNFQKQISLTSFSCLTNFYTQYCVNCVSNPESYFCYTTCVDCLTCNWCIAGPTYNFITIASDVCNRIYMARCMF